MCNSHLSLQGGRTRFVQVDPPLYLFVSLATIVALHLLVPRTKVISAPTRFPVQKPDTDSSKSDADRNFRRLGLNGFQREI